MRKAFFFFFFYKYWRRENLNTNSLHVRDQLVLLNHRVLDHGFKNRTGERTAKGSGSRTGNPTSVVEPVTS